MAERSIVVNLKFLGSATAAALRKHLLGVKDAGEQSAKGMTEGEKESAKFAAGLEKLSGQVGGIKSLLAGLGLAAAGVWVGNKIKDGFEEIVSTATDFEQRLSQIRKTTGLTSKELLGLRETLGTLAITTAGLKLDDLFDTAAMGGRLGVAGDKIAAFTRDINMVSLALEIPAEEAATGIQRILNVFHLGTSQAINFASALNKLDDTSTATGKDILDIAARISGSASVLGLSPQKVLALSATLKDAGLENEVAGSAISQIFGKMATEIPKFAMIAGVSMERFAKTLRADPLAALQLFERGLKRFDAITQFEALEQLGLDGVRTKGVLLQLGAVMDKIPGYVRTANREWKSLASINKEVEIQGQTTKAQLDRMTAAWQVLSMTVGDAVLPVVRSVAGSFVTLTGNIKDWLKASAGPIGEWSKKLENAGSALGLLITDFKLFTDLGKEFALEKWEQFETIIGRLGPMLQSNASVWGGNMMAGLVGALANDQGLFQAVIDGMGVYATAVFKELGSVITDVIVRPFRKAQLQFEDWQLQRNKLVIVMQQGQRAFDEQEFAITRELHEIAVAERGGGGDLAARLDRAGKAFKQAQKDLQARAEAGVRPMPGFGGLTENLPGRPGVQTAADALAARQQQAAAQAEAARQAALPKPEFNPFAGKTLIQLEAAHRKMLARQTKEREDALKEEIDADRQMVSLGVPEATRRWARQENALALRKKQQKEQQQLAQAEEEAADKKKASRTTRPVVAPAKPDYIGTQPGEAPRWRRVPPPAPRPDFVGAQPTAAPVAHRRGQLSPAQQAVVDQAEARRAARAPRPAVPAAAPRVKPDYIGTQPGAGLPPAPAAPAESEGHRRMREQLRDEQARATPPAPGPQANLAPAVGAAGAAVAALQRRQDALTAEILRVARETAQAGARLNQQVASALNWMYT